jgi:biopolymer transport protein ExbB
MESQFGIANVWIQGDFVTRAVAMLLLAMSLASWIVILIKALDIIKFKKHARAAQDFWHSEDFAAGLTKLGNDPPTRFATWPWKAARPRPTTATPRPTCTTAWT